MVEVVGLVEVVDVVEVVEVVDVVDVVDVVEVVEMVELVKIDCEKSIKLETSPKVTKSKRNLHWYRSITVTKIPAHFLLQYQSKSYYIIGQEVYYSIGRFVTLSGSYYIIGRFFITLSGTYYSIGRLLHYRFVHQVSSVIHALCCGVSGG